jgi:DNA invertase Pin-like site-specific DNA recombinase
LVFALATEVKMRVIIYSRVSTSEQNPKIQSDELKKFVERMEGWTLVDVIEDHGYSGATSDRPGLKDIMVRASKKEFDILLIKKLDRLFRSVSEIVSTVTELQHRKISLMSLDDNIDFNSPAGKLQFHLMAALAEFERSLIKSRVVASLKWAKENGVVLGRPQKHDPSRIIELRKLGMSYRNIVKETGAPLGVVSRIIAGALKTEAG